MSVRCLSVSLPHCLTVSLSHCLTRSLTRCFVPLARSRCRPGTRHSNSSTLDRTTARHGRSTAASIGAGAGRPPEPARRRHNRRFGCCQNSAHFVLSPMSTRPGSHRRPFGPPPYIRLRPALLVLRPGTNEQARLLAPQPPAEPLPIGLATTEYGGARRSCRQISQCRRPSPEEALRQDASYGQ